MCGEEQQVLGQREAMVMGSPLYYLLFFWKFFCQFQAKVEYVGWLKQKVPAGIKKKRQ